MKVAEAEASKYKRKERVPPALFLVEHENAIGEICGEGDPAEIRDEQDCGYSVDWPGQDNERDDADF